MSELLDRLDSADQERLEKADMPAKVSPMLATLTHEHFSDPDWVYERKLDGERCLAFHGPDGTRLLSRNGQSLDDTFPELRRAVSESALTTVVADGEVVAFDGNVTSFSRLQKRIGIHDAERARASRVSVYLYFFDLIHCEGYDLTALPLRRRKQLLREVFEWHDPLRWTPHRNRTGEVYYREACRKGWEGVIAKRADAAYVHKRSRDWLKFKCSARQELVIGGYTDPKGSRKGFGALLLGYYEDHQLRYAGRVGTGFDDDMLETLSRRLERLARKTPPFEPPPDEKDDVHWVSPRIVGEIGFTEWTRDGRLRHPRFLGLRTDKPPEDVVRERAVDD